MGKLYVVATPIGNLKDITFRAIEVLKSCPIIAAEDTNHTKILLKKYEIENKTIISYHKYNEEKRVKLFLDLLIKKNLDIALVSDAGTPCISDPGYQIVKTARENNIDVIPIPGPSSLIAALSISGLPLNTFYFAGFLPKSSKRTEYLKKIEEKEIETFVIYESPKRIDELLQDILKIFPNSILCVCRELTKTFEKVYYGNIEKVIEEVNKDPYKEKGEYTIIVHRERKAKKDFKKDISIEAILFDELIKQDLSLKDAIEKVSKKLNIPKKEVYKASINLKEKIKRIL
uniref:Ribosomal RNA small subunit methyltransferase I n=1 Tax=Dictyoglomus thermophilum TaxID=14 RepID=A0A7C3MJ20_DICTH